MTTTTGHATPSHLTMLDGGTPPPSTDPAMPPAGLEGAAGLTLIDPAAGLAPTGAPAAPTFAPITPPPPLMPRHVRPGQAPPGPLRDLAYRWLARVALIGVPDSSGQGRPTVLTLTAAHVPTEAMPLPLLIRDPESSPEAPRLIQVGTVTRVYLADASPGPLEVCASGEFDLTKPGVPALVGELTRAAERGSPMTAVPQLAGLEYSAELEPAEGAVPVEVAGTPRYLTRWRLNGLVLGHSATWAGCYLVPDAARVPVVLDEVPYAMRRHYNPEVWRSMVRAWRSAVISGVPTWDALTRTLDVLGAATTTAEHDAIARRLFDPGDPLTLNSLMATLPGIVDRLDADDAARGGGL